jgi:ribonuclease P protein component
MRVERRERLARDDRMRRSRDISAVKAEGSRFRGRCCILLVLARPGEPTRVGFVASRKSVGGAVQRNRARRRLREIVRRRWPRIVPQGYWMMFIALRAVLTAPHQALATDVEHQLASAGAITPIEPVAP